MPARRPLVSSFTLAPYRAASSDTGYSSCSSSVRAPAIRITHGPSPAPTKTWAVPAGQWKKSHGSEEPLLALDEEPALAGQHEEPLLL